MPLSDRGKGAKGSVEEGTGGLREKKGCRKKQGKTAPGKKKPEGSGKS